MINLLVVIINYKTPELTCQSIASVITQLGGNDKVCVVDNFSQDNSIELLTQYIQTNNLHEKVNLIASPVNGGFSAGNNVGITSESAKYYFLLNSDAYIKEYAIERLIAKMEQDKTIGIIAPQLIWENERQQTSCFYYLTPFNSFINAANTGCISRIFKKLGVHEVAIPFNKHQSENAEWLSFAGILLRNSLIHDVGLMDENYFMYYEDMDYCRRADLAGWKLAYENEAKVVHLNQGASNQQTVKRLPLFYFKSRKRYFVKYYGYLGLFLANISWSLGRFISLSREMIQRKTPLFHSSMIIDIWAGFLTSEVREVKNEK